MLFNSFDFALFLPIVFFIYWFLLNKNLKAQNVFLVLASYFFYGWWDWRFLFLIFLSTSIDYAVGIGLAGQKDRSKRKILLWTSILANLGILGFFKYYNFFIENFSTAFSFLGAEIRADSLDIILPLGISFYTFQTMSYAIDVYRKKMEPTRDFVSFAAFVSFFPQLVAGPIERAKNLLPQFYARRKFDYAKASDGMRQILWGLFKKIVIADNCATYADMIFANSADYSGSTLALGAFLFAFQIYCDFSGYSDIAIGTARLFGFDLIQNFAFPYFSRDIAEFWRRWHISLSTWFRDYLYIPLGGSRGTKWEKTRNTFIIFIVGGLWHGADWKFIFWGALNALYFLPLLLCGKNRDRLEIAGKGKIFPDPKEALLMLSTFFLTAFAWIFFRAESLGHASDYISEIFSRSFFSAPEILPAGAILLIIFLMVTEWYGREDRHALSALKQRWKQPYRWAFYLLIMILIFKFGVPDRPFIYFQF